VVVKREKLCGSASSDFRIGLAAGQAISAATRRRGARILGATASGLLGVTFFSAAVAFADNYDIAPDPTSTEVVTGLYGLGTALPAVDGSVQGHQVFDLDNTTLSQVVGTFDADEAASSDAFGGTNEELLVTSDLSGTAGTGAGDVPPVGSVLDTFTLGDTGYANIYSATPGADTISDTLITPSGDYTIPLTYDAATEHAGNTAASVLAPVSTVDVTAISGIPPVAVAFQGSQEFETAAGTFDADTTTTSDIIGNSTEAILVTSASGVTGTAAGDVPPVGSVFNVLETGFSGYDNVYSDIPSTTPGGADVITDTLVTPFGDFAIPNTFDASAVITGGAVPVPLGDDYDIIPASTEQYEGINGVPPLDVAIQGEQKFEVEQTTLGSVAGKFDADVSTASDSSGDINEAILVTSDVSGTTGTATGDVPPVGSVFDTITYGDSGFENIYIDMASTTAGADTITDTLVTPFGDFTIPTSLDVAAGLASDMFGSV
jgi:hypothetical protein